jgi:hypothetical protein
MRGPCRFWRLPSMPCMSSAARWSYTATATVWPLLGRDDWTGVLSFGAPAAFACDYAAEAKRVTDSTGIEFTTQLMIWTELADIKRGDRVLIGASAATDPVAAGASEVRAVKRSADTFERAADDYTVMT